MSNNYIILSFTNTPSKQLYYFFIIIFSSFSDILEDAPDKHELLDLLADIKDKWYEIGLSLKVGDDVINGLTSEKIENIIKLDKVLQSWIKTESSPVTWDTMIAAIEGPLVNNVQKAKKILEYLTKGKLNKPMFLIL